MSDYSGRCMDCGCSVRSEFDDFFLCDDCDDQRVYRKEIRKQHDFDSMSLDSDNY